MESPHHYGAVRGPRNAAIATVLLASAALASCSFRDLFADAGPGDLEFVWVGDTVVTVGASTPFHVTLMVDGLPAPSPAVRIAIPDTTVITFGATADSIVGRRPGQADVVAWIESSLAARVDTVFRIRSRP